MLTYTFNDILLDLATKHLDIVSSDLLADLELTVFNACLDTLFQAHGVFLHLGNQVLTALFQLLDCFITLVFFGCDSPVDPCAYFFDSFYLFGFNSFKILSKLFD